MGGGGQCDEIVVRSVTLSPDWWHRDAKRPDLVERDVAGSIDADGERERAGGIADVAFDHGAVLDEHDRPTRGDVDEAAVAPGD